MAFIFETDYGLETKICSSQMIIEKSRIGLQSVSKIGSMTLPELKSMRCSKVAMLISFGNVFG